MTVVWNGKQLYKWNQPSLRSEIRSSNLTTFTVCNIHYIENFVFFFSFESALHFFPLSLSFILSIFSGIWLWSLPSYRFMSQFSRIRRFSFVAALMFKILVCLFFIFFFFFFFTPLRFLFVFSVHFGIYIISQEYLLFAFDLVLFSHPLNYSSLIPSSCLLCTRRIKQQNIEHRRTKSTNKWKKKKPEKTDWQSKRNRKKQTCYRIDYGFVLQLAW